MPTAHSPHSPNRAPRNPTPLIETPRYAFTGRSVWPDLPPEHAPLVVALHGGTYSSAYFDVPDYSLLDQAQGLGIAAIALDRPGYGHSTALPAATADIGHNAEVLNEAIGALWKRHGGTARGVVLVGHSIGGAIATTVASLRPDWPLLGLAVSGVGLRANPGDHERWGSFPEGDVVIPNEIKDHVMFGPPGSFDTDMPAASHVACTAAPRAELLDITGPWSEQVRARAARVQVPVHYRQAEHDRLWVTGADEVQGFGAAFTGAPVVDAAVWPDAGHCIDFHHSGGAFQRQQLAFALACAARR